MKSCTCDAYPPRPSLVMVHTRSNMSISNAASIPAKFGGCPGLDDGSSPGGTLKLLGTNTQAEPSPEGQCTCRRKWPKTEFFTYYGWSGRCIWVLVAAQSMGTLRGTYTRSWAFCGTLGSLVPTHAIQLGPSNQRIPPRSHPNRLSRGDYYFFLDSTYWTRSQWLFIFELSALCCFLSALLPLSSSSFKHLCTSQDCSRFDVWGPPPASPTKHTRVAHSNPLYLRTPPLYLGRRDRVHSISVYY